MIKKAILVTGASYINAVAALLFSFGLINLLSKEEFGIWSMINSLAAISAIFALLGFPRAYQNVVARGGEYRKHVFQKMSLRALFIGLCIAIMVFFFFWLPFIFEQPAWQHLALLVLLIMHFIFVDYGVIGSQITGNVKALTILAIHSSLVRMTALVVVWILIQAPSLTDIIIYSVMSQVAVSAMIFYLYVIKWNSASLLEKNYTDNKILRNLGPKRAQFFTSNLGFVVSTYISVLLVGAYGSPEDAANLQIIVLIMNLVMVFPNAIYGKLLGFRVQQVAHKGEVKLSEVISQSAIMCLLGVVFTMVAVVTMNILIQLFFHEYNQIENFTLFLILSVIAVKYSGSYILAVFNYSNLILHKTMSQWFSIVLFVVLFYAVPLNDLVEKVLVATLVAEIIRLMLTGIKARSFFGKRANA